MLYKSFSIALSLPPMKLSDYLKAERGRFGKVAERAGLAPAFLSQIANGLRGAPAERGADIERACEFHVRRWDLRPDDWHRIWPELIGTEGAPDVPAVDVARDAA
jgi:DNA-binding transcriptional regulator YdaS (Cro superfamily)